MSDEPTGESPNANELHDAISGLERRRAELKQGIDEKKRVVAGYRKKLELLEGGFFGKKGRRWPIVLLVVVIMVGGGLAYYVVNRGLKMPTPKPTEYRPLVPRLLVTTVPDGAEVLIDGKVVGHAPLLWRAPEARRLAVKVQMLGYKPATKAVAVSARTGAHWHAVLDPELAASEKTPKNE